MQYTQPRTLTGRRRRLARRERAQSCSRSIQADRQPRRKVGQGREVAEDSASTDPPGLRAAPPCLPCPAAAVTPVGGGHGQTPSNHSPVGPSPQAWRPGAQRGSSEQPVSTGMLLTPALGGHTCAQSHPGQWASTRNSPVWVWLLPVTGSSEELRAFSQGDPLPLPHPSRRSSWESAMGPASVRFRETINEQITKVAVAEESGFPRGGW